MTIAETAQSLRRGRALLTVTMFKELMRDFGLAVLDEAESAAIAGFQPPGSYTNWNNSPLLVLRREIEELGK